MTEQTALQRLLERHQRPWHVALCKDSWEIDDANDEWTGLACAKKEMAEAIIEAINTSRLDDDKPAGTMPGREEIARIIDPIIPTEDELAKDHATASWKEWRRAETAKIYRWVDKILALSQQSAAPSTTTGAQEAEELAKLLWDEFCPAIGQTPGDKTYYESIAANIISAGYRKSNPPGGKAP